ncbi:2,5-diketo-D-gluconic acid reductase B [Methylobacterium crusticola]|uniref:2,5-diketo-D-gluconic acid reductase B n=1 Tax=Methylobacterium crusticola TaxID=1697972 RepID=A0ABQ4R7H3_9HYPH|nr:aldo/keto reductase [Methylobacterium crusticola]GJD53670.1 2,5-diketo-D-gluconic acid reductase B [Methylobacterium crusticola]
MDSIDSQGVTIPRLGLGTFRLQGEECRRAVEGALALGYRHIDTAAMYQNEDAVGAAIAAAGIARDALFVTTKVWHDQLAPEALRRAFDASLARLGLDHVDLYLVHWPAQGMDLGATLEALMRLREQGRTRAIGVCNFNLPLIRQAVEEIGAPIAAHQIEYHPFLAQTPMLAYLRGRGIPLTAYAPLAQGRAAQDETLARIGAKHGATATQVALAWLLDQDGVMAIPKAGRPESQRGNLDALAIRLDDADRAAVAALPKDQRFVRPAFAPDWDATAAA